MALAHILAGAPGRIAADAHRFSNAQVAITRDLQKCPEVIRFLGVYEVCLSVIDALNAQDPGPPTCRVDVYHVLRLL